MVDCLPGHWLLYLWLIVFSALTAFLVVDFSNGGCMLLKVDCTFGGWLHSRWLIASLVFFPFWWLIVFLVVGCIIGGYL